MPEYKGIVVYLFDVLVHVLRNYAVVALIYPVMVVPFLLAAFASGTFLEAIKGWVALFINAGPFLLGCVHLLVFACLRYYFLPRFPYAPAVITFILAALFGSALVSLNWAANRLGLFNGEGVLPTMWEFGLALGIAVAGVLLGKLFERLGGFAGMHFGLGKWAGRLIVGRAAYDAFLEQEEQRLRQE